MQNCSSWLRAVFPGVALVLSAAMAFASSADTQCAPERVEVTLFGVGDVERAVSIASDLVRDRSQALPCDGRIRVKHLVLRVSEHQILAGDDPSPINVTISVSLPDGIERYVAYLKKVGAISAPKLDQSTGLSYAVELTPKKDPFIAIHVFYSEADKVLIKCRQYLTKESGDPTCTVLLVEDSMSFQVGHLNWSDRPQWREMKRALISLVGRPDARGKSSR